MKIIIMIMPKLKVRTNI